MRNYCAFLRGVNVHGTRMHMKEVCEIFENEGLQNVSSVLATGNILFRTTRNPDDLQLNLKKALSERFSYDAHLFIQSAEEIKTIINNNPFSEDVNFHNYVFIGTENIGRILLDYFNDCAPLQGEKVQFILNKLFWRVKKGDTLKSEFGKILGKKSFKNQMTSRNLNTFEKVLIKFENRTQ